VNFWVCFLHAFAYVKVGHLKVATFCASWWCHHDQTDGTLVLP